VKPRRTYTDYILDMLDYARKARSFVGTLELDEFQKNDQTILATVRALEVVGEAARHIPKSLRDRYPGIPWKKVVGMRNIMIHEYFGVDAEVIWKTVREDLPRLSAELDRILADTANRK
jgi:uncharacterized protein with HEPN domain